MNGYTQINIGGKLRGWKWGKYSSELYVMLKSKGVSKDMPLSGAFFTDDFNAIAYAGLLMNCYVKQVDPDFTFEDLVDWMEILPEEELKKMTEAMTSSQFWQDNVLAKKKEVVQPVLKSGTSKHKKKGSLPSGS